MRLRRCSRLIAVLAAVQLLTCTAYAIDASNVLVLYNPDSTDGQEIADYYAAVHPGVQTLAITGLSGSEYMTADDYLRVDDLNPGLRQQVLGALTPNTQVIVTTKGMPLRIQVTEPEPTAVFPNLPTYTDPMGVQHSILNWQPYSSLESELASIQKVSSWEMMGDQVASTSAHFAKNPYYGSTVPFDHATTGTFLTSRLDGYSVDDVTHAIDNAQHAFVGPAGNSQGPIHFVVDKDDNPPYSTTMTRLVDNVLTPAGLPLTLDTTGAFIGTSSGPVIGYDSYGVHPYTETPANYIVDSNNGLNLTLADGAVFTSVESYNAYSFNEGGYGGSQGQVAQWLQIGGTAGVGNVEEPTATWITLSNEDILFKNLLAGMTFAESAWAADYQLSFVNTVIGDPLMVWHTLTYGDINEDGKVNISDLVLMSNHWGQTVTPGGFSWTLGDLNSDGHVDISDLVLLSNHWGEVSSWAAGPSNAAEISPQAFLAVVEPMLHPTPEPASSALLGAGIAALLVCRTRAGRRTAVRSAGG